MDVEANLTTNTRIIKTIYHNIFALKSPDIIILNNVIYNGITDEDAIENFNLFILLAATSFQEKGYDVQIIPSPYQCFAYEDYSICKADDVEISWDYL